MNFSLESLAKYVKLETCTFNFLILSPLTNKIHNINILTHFRFGQSCIAFILFVKVIYTRKDIMYHVNINIYIKGKLSNNICSIPSHVDYY